MTDTIKKIKVVAYARVSTSTKDQRNSFNNQKEYFEKIARESEIYDLVEIYADEGITGTSLKKRDDFLRMIHDAGIDVHVDQEGNYTYLVENNREAEFKKILIKDITRFSRNLDTITLYRALNKKGVSLLLTNLGMEFSSVHDETNLSILLAFSQHESVDRSKKIRFGLERSAEKGIVKMAKQLYGYQYDPETKIVSVVEEEAEVVRIIFDLYVNKNMGVRRITQYLEKNGFKTKEGKNFGYSTVTRMIANRKYCGDMVYFKYDSGEVLNKYSSHKVRPEEEWVIHEDVFPVIIPKEMFEKAQELRRTRTSHMKGKKQAITEYSKLIVCGNCGAFYGRNKANGKYVMNCMTKKRYGVKKCDYPNIKVEDLDNIINTLTEENFYNRFIAIRNVQVEKLQNLKEELTEKMNRDIPKEYYLKKAELDKFYKQKQKILDLYLDEDNNFDKDMLDEKARIINESISTIQGQLDKLFMPISKIEGQIKEINKRIEELNNLKVKKNLKKEDVLSLIGRIDVTHVFDEIQLEIRFKINETINNALSTLKPNEDLDKILEVPFFETIKAGHNVPVRIPDNIEVPEGFDARKWVNEFNKKSDKVANNLEKLMSLNIDIDLHQ